MKIPNILTIITTILIFSLNSHVFALENDKIDECQSTYYQSEQYLEIPCVVSKHADNTISTYSIKLNITDEQEPKFTLVDIINIEELNTSTQCISTYDEHNHHLTIPCAYDGNKLIGSLTFKHDTSDNTFLLQRRYYQPIAIPSRSQRAVVAFKGKGFDSCVLPTVSQLDVWYDYSPYKVVNLYIGGKHRYSGCVAGNEQRINKENLLKLSEKGWKFIPTWVGPEQAYSSDNITISNGYSKGEAEAEAAIQKAISVGLTADGSGTIIYYDIEYESGEANQQLIRGWSNKLRQYGSKSGVYGSTAKTRVAQFAGLTDAVWMAEYAYSYYNPNYQPDSVFDILYNRVPDTAWPNQQRILQYNNTHNETYGGVTISIDSDLIDGLVADISTNSTSSNVKGVFDGAGSLVNPSQECFGCNKDYAVMQPHSYTNSTVAFQWLYSSSSCAYIDITATKNITAVIRSKAWSEHLTQKAIKVSLSSSPITLSRPSSNSWTTLAITSTAPVSSPVYIKATCLAANGQIKAGNRSNIATDLVDVTYDYYWTGTGSLISNANRTGFGVTKDLAATFHTKNSLTSFQWLALERENCTTVQVKDSSGKSIGASILNGVHIKPWNGSKWSDNVCNSLPCNITAPDQDYYIIKVKSAPDAFSGYLQAQCVK